MLIRCLPSFRFFKISRTQTYPFFYAGTCKPWHRPDWALSCFWNNEIIKIEYWSHHHHHSKLIFFQYKVFMNSLPLSVYCIHAEKWWYVLALCHSLRHVFRLQILFRVSSQNQITVHTKHTQKSSWISCVENFRNDKHWSYFRKRKLCSPCNEESTL